MKQIPLTQGKFALVDDDDFEWLSQWKWFSDARAITYAIRHQKMIKGVHGPNMRMHREIMKAATGDQVDHIDGNGLNNQRDNLRIVSIRQNSQNRHGEKSSLYPGVTWHKRRNVWQAAIYKNGKSVHLGCFSNQYDAFCAYKKASAELGEEVLSLEPALYSNEPRIGAEPVSARV